MTSEYPVGAKQNPMNFISHITFLRKVHNKSKKVKNFSLEFQRTLYSLSVVHDEIYRTITYFLMQLSL